MSPHLLVLVVVLRLLLVQVVVLVPVHVGVGVAVVSLVGVARRVRGLVAKQSNIKHGDQDMYLSMYVLIM